MLFVTAVLAFISTNIDDIFVLMLCFTAAKMAKQRLAVVLGQYLGTALLTAVSVCGALGLKLFEKQYLCWLGLIPIFLSIRALFAKADEIKSAVGILPVAAITVANGADNIGIYLPLFASLDAMQTVWTVLIFTVMIGLWCICAAYIASMPAVQRLIAKQKWLVPVVYLLLGIRILLSGIL